MDSINNMPDASVKAPSFGADFLSSLDAELGAGEAASGLFADLLSQTRIQELPPPPQNSQQSQSVQKNAAETNANGADATDSANDPDNTAINTNSPSAAASQTAGQTETKARSPAGKLLRHDAARHEASHKGKSQKSTDHKSGQTSATSIITPHILNAALSTDDTLSAGDTGTQTPAANAAPATTAAAGPAQATNTQNAAAADASSSPSTTDNATKGNDLASSDPELAMLLLQLERFAAQRLGGAVPVAAGTGPSVSGDGQGSAAATGTASVPPAKTDLKALLAALDTGGSVGENKDGQANNADAGAASNTAASPAATSAAPQNTVTKASTAPPGTENTNWATGELFNLFNPMTGNPDNAGIPFAPGPPSGALLATFGGSDNASLDADGQGQDGGARNGAAGNALDGNNSTLLAAGTPPPASPYDFASQLSALRAAKGGTTGLPSPVEQVILQMGRAAKDGSNQMTIQLRPAELGRIDVKLNVSSDGKVQGTVTADNPATLGLLLKDVRSLERALQEAGLCADSGSLQFNLRGDGQSGSGFNQTANQSDNGGSANVSPTSTVLPAATGPIETYYLTPGGVNMRV